jgi:hypothetical protein
MAHQVTEYHLPRQGFSTLSGSSSFEIAQKIELIQWGSEGSNASELRKSIPSANQRPLHCSFYLQLPNRATAIFVCMRYTAQLRRGPMYECMQCCHLRRSVGHGPILQAYASAVPRSLDAAASRISPVRFRSPSQQKNKIKL